MPRKVMNFDLRHPARFSTTGAEVYAAALDMAAWADEHGFERVSVPEHHQNEDGYLSCPLLVVAAFGARTRRITVRTGVILAPLYHPLRLAEEVAVADLCTQGRLELGLGLGNVPDDFVAFGVDRTRRGQLMEELIPMLRTAWTGEPFEYQGRTVRVTPRPVRDPLPIYLGGGSRRAADRAARLADGFHTATPEYWEYYREACVAHGKADPGPRVPRGPMFLWVTKDDPQRVREQLQPHFDHQARSYQAQADKSGMQSPGPWVPKPGERSPYEVVGPQEAIEMANRLGPDGELIFHPLLAGISPRMAWEMLDVLEHDVLPHLDH